MRRYAEKLRTHRGPGSNPPGPAKLRPSRVADTPIHSFFGLVFDSILDTVSSCNHDRCVCTLYFIGDLGCRHMRPFKGQKSHLKVRSNTLERNSTISTWPSKTQNLFRMAIRKSLFISLCSPRGLWINLSTKTLLPSLGASFLI